MTEPKKSSLPAQLGNALLLAIFAGFTLWYLYDAWSASPSAENLILIAPIGVLALICIAVAVGLEIRARLGRGSDGEATSPISPKTLALMAALVIYVGAMPYIGFDTATFLFSISGAFAMGERRPFMLVVFAFLLTTIVIVTFKHMQPVPLPLLLDIWP